MLLCAAAAVQRARLSSACLVLQLKGIRRVGAARSQNKANVGIISFPLNAPQSHRALHAIHKQCIYQHIQEYALNY